MKISEVAVKQNVLTYVVAMLLIIFGVIGYQNLGMDLMPNIDMPIVTVQTLLPGASPTTVETSVTEVIEEMVAPVSGIDTLTSQSSYGISIVVVQFDLEKDADDALEEVRQKLDAVSARLPTDAEKPIILKMDMENRPVCNLILSGNAEISTLTRIAEQELSDRILQIEGVGGVDVRGGRDREIRIWLSIEALEQYQIAVDDISSAFSRQHIELPGGMLKTSDIDFVVSTESKFEDITKLKKMIIAYRNGAPIYLEQVARVEDGLEEEQVISRYNGTSCVSLSIRKKSDGNIIQVVDNVKKMLPEFRSFLPKDTRITLSNDRSRYIRSSIDNTLEELIIGAIMAILVTFLFLRNIRSTFIVAIILPTTIVATFFFIQLFGFTLNNISLLALSLSVGILIDDAIVMVENIWRHIEMGKSRLQATKDGAGQIVFTVIAISLTVLSAFIPIAFADGIIGKFLLELGVTVSVAIVISLILALTLTPALSSRFLVEPNKKNKFYEGLEKGMHALERFYAPILKWCLRFRWLTVLIGLVILGLTLFSLQGMKMEFMTSQDRGQFNVSMEAPPGTPLHVSEAYIKQIEEVLLRDDRIVSVYSTIAGDTMQSSNKGTLSVDLVPQDEREESQFQIVAAYREIMKPIIENAAIPIKIEIKSPSMGGTQAPLSIQISGPDLENLESIAHEITGAWGSIEGLSDISSTIQQNKPEVRIVPKRTYAAHAQVNALQLTSTVNALIAGKKVSTYEDDGEQYDIRLQLEAFQRNELQDLNSIKVRNSAGKLVDLGALVDLYIGESPVQIDHQDGLRSITLSAWPQDGYVIGDLIGPAQQKVSQTLDAYGPQYKQIIQGDAKRMRESMGAMMFAMVLGFIIIYLVMAAQFNSFVYPITIMVAIPFSFIGAFLALNVTQISMNMMSLIALLLLMGLVVRNAIIVITFVIDLRKEGVEKTAAIQKAAVMRLRPILMTTISLICGMIPVALGLGEGSEMRQPMGVTIIGGMITSTLLTLIFIPVVYSLLDSFMNTRIIRWFQKIIFKEQKAAQMG